MNRMPTTELQLFVLANAYSIRWRPLPVYSPRGEAIVAPFIGRRNVSSPVKTLCNRRWLKTVYVSPKGAYARTTLHHRTPCR